MRKATGESVDNLEAAEIKCSFFSGSDGKICKSDAVMIYDLFESVIECAYSSLEYIVIKLDLNETSLELRLMLGCDIDKEEIILLPQVQKIFNQNGTVSVKKQDSDVIICANLKKVGEPYE